MELVSPVRFRNALTAIALTLSACSKGPQHRVEHAGDARPDPKVEAEAAPAPATPPESPEPVVEEPRAELPTDCHQQGELCLPAPKVVDRLCRAAHVSTAIRLFSKSSPLTRGYVRMREVRAANLRGGPVGNSALTFAEEVLILAQHGGSGEIQVSGTGGFDVLRWDGTCATLSDEELVMTRVPAPPRHAEFTWKYLDDDIQQALLQNETIKSAHESERKRCRGMSPGDRSASCREATERLNERVVFAIRTGMDLPMPENAP